MSKIQLLPDIVANQIAAGEVVERPASVAKELLENALDAGATRVEVEIEQGGKNLIRIRDDGEGMTRDDTLLAFERHATSKIRTVEDLNAIDTFGFRGEALASIASVSRITLFSKLRDDVAGTELVIEGGRIRHVRDASWPGGTEISVRDLFFNVPARRKFLKTETTESFHVTNLVTHYALANPEKAFVLRNNGREIIQVTPTASLRDRAYQLFGEALLEELVKVEFSQNEITVGGFISRPQQQRASRDGQYLFVNGRYVKDRVLGRAVSDAYRNIIPPGFYPSVLLFVEVSPEEVDVNVHPQKTEVRFRRAQAVLETVRDGLKLALGVEKPFAHFPGLSDLRETETAASAVPPSAEELIEPPFLSPPAEPVEVGSLPERRLELPRPAIAQPVLDRNFKAELAARREELERLEHTEPVSESSRVESRPIQPPPFFLTSPKGEPVTPVRPELELFPQLARQGSRSGRSLCAQRRTRTPESYVAASPLELPRQDFRILGQLHESYIIATDARGLLLIDQHVAHERVLFEQHLRRLMSREVVSQKLLIPHTLDLTPAQAAAFEHTMADLDQCGFDVMQLSGRTIALRALPAELEPEEARTLLIELLDVVEEEQRSVALEHFQREIAAGLACRAAIKVNKVLNLEKMTWLIDELMRTENPTNCPHGRPVLLRFDMQDIERGFKRI